MDERKEDEIEIDLSKVKNLFKKFISKEEHKNMPNLSAGSSSLSDSSNNNNVNQKEINIDFSKIKSKVKKIFTSDHDKGDDINFDFSKITGFIKTHTTLCILLLLMILQFLPNYGFLPWGGIYMRMIGQDLPRIDSVAEENVYAFYKNQILNAINKQSPNLPELQKNEIVEEQFRTFLKQNKGAVEQQIKATSEQAKEHYRYEGGNGEKYTYMPDIDPYLFIRYARNYLDHGFLGDKIIDGKQIDDHNVAPLGTEKSPKDLHPYLLAYMHLFFSFLKKDIPLMQSATYFPIIFMFLTVIPAFFIGRKLSNNLGGFIFGLLLLVHPAIISRTQWGHADTDPYNIFFPLYIIWFFLESLDEKNVKIKIMYSLLTGFTIGLYYLAWNGFFLINFILLTVLIFVGLTLTKKVIMKKDIFKDKSFKNIVYTSLLQLFCITIFVSLFKSFAELISSLLLPFQFIYIKVASHPNLWPNVYTTVAELNPASFNDIINQFGAWFMFIAIFGTVLIMLKGIFDFYTKDRLNEVRLISAIILLVWISSTIYASTKGLRFFLLLTPPFALALSTFFGLLYQYASYVAKIMSIRILFVRIIVTVVSLSVISVIVVDGYSVSLQDLPIMNDAWWNVLTTIKERSAPDSIITSWWDYGHHFKFVADRKVTFDGGSQNSPQAYWVGKLFLTSDEDQSIGILRMLNCGSNLAFETVYNQTNNTVMSVNIINNIIVLDKTNAREYLFKYNIKDSEQVLKYTHCNPPESLVITSVDMIGKAGVWGHFGSWDFEKADLWINVKKLSRDKSIDYMNRNYNYSIEKSEKRFIELQSIKNEDEANKWIAPWPGFILANTAPCLKVDKILKCNNGLIVEDNNATVLGNSINSVVYIDNNKNYKIKTFNNNAGFSAVLIPNENEVVSIITSPEIATSVFTRLYFMEGHGLKYFKLFTADKEVLQGNANLYVWKVDWSGNQTNIIKSLFERENVEDGSSVSLNLVGWLENGTIFDSTIINWKNLNITKDVNFKDFPTNPQKIPVTKALQKNIYDVLLNHKKGDEVFVSVKAEDSFFSDDIKKEFSNKTFSFRFVIEKIT